MEILLAYLIENSKIPKVMRYLIVIAMSIFIFFVGILCVVKSPIIIGKVFGIILCILTLAAEGYLINKIHKS